MAKITITKDDLAAAERISSGETSAPAGPTASRFLARLLMAFLVLVPPLLCIMALVLWLALKKKSDQVRAAWTGYLCWLLIASGVISSVAATALFAKRFVPHLPTAQATSLTSLDNALDFPDLSVRKELSPPEIAAKLKRLVFVVVADSLVPLARTNPPSGSMGACALLQSGTNGHLLVTCRHVVDGENWQGHEAGRNDVVLFSQPGNYAKALVIGRHKKLDLALLWLPRHDGNSSFVQPIQEFAKIQDGEAVFLFGHPEGLLFSMSSGIVSRKDAEGRLQISAPVSPGNSGGPIYDATGRLLGIVSWKVDRTRNPNAENLNFGVMAEAILKTDGWILDKTAETRLKEFVTACRMLGGVPNPSPETKQEFPAAPDKKNQ